jgi:hypothetical protein
MIDLTVLNDLNDIPIEYLLVYISIGWLQALIFNTIINKFIINYLNTDLIGMSNQERELKFFIGNCFFVMFWPFYSTYLLVDLIIFLSTIRIGFSFEINKIDPETDLERDNKK